MRFDRRAVPWERIATALLLACAAVPLRSRVRDVAATDHGAYCRDESDFHVERGDAILHGVPLPGVAWAMPFYSVPNAFLCRRLSGEASVAVRAAVLLAGAALVFASGALLDSGLCGAGALFLYALLPFYGAGGERWLYGLTLMFAAYFLVRRARAPSLAASVRLGAAIGASLLVLPPLFLFPFLLVLWEWRRDRRSGAARARDAAALCLIPFLFLIPWVAMNWRLSGRFVLFDDGRVDDNIITGALGFVRTMASGDSRGLAPIPAGRHILLWAVGEILRHPLRYLAAFCARFVYAASLHPLLVLASAGAAWRARKREDFRQLALLAAYFFAIHCLMPVQTSYFVPIWPVVAVLAAGLIAARARPVSHGEHLALAAGSDAFFTLLLFAQACVLGLVWAYPARARENGALERELARDPNDPWLWSERGMGLLRSGRATEAAGDLGRALALDPQGDREIRYAWALLAEGAPGARVWEHLSPGTSSMRIDFQARVLRAIYLALEGRRAEADDALESARTFGRSAGAIANSLPQVVFEIVSSWPAARRPALIEFLEDAPALRDVIGKDAWAQVWLEAARRDLAAGDRRAALEHLDFAEKEGLSDEAKFRAAVSGLDGDGADFAALLLQRLRDRRPEQADRLLDAAAKAAKAGRPARALRILELADNCFSLDPERLRRAAVVARDAGGFSQELFVVKRLDLSGPKDADLLLDLAAAAAKSGRRPEALESLALAEGMRLDPERTRRLAAGYGGLGDSRGAARVLRRLQDDAGSWLDRAEAAAASGDRASALAAAARASSVSLADSDARRLVLIDQGLGEYARALEIADLRIRARPGDARWRSDRGVLHALLGEREAAVADWKSALALDPDLLAPYLSLGSLYASSHRRKEALDLYEKAMRRPRIKNDAGASRQILAERAKPPAS